MKKQTILIVEDDERFRKMLSFLFCAKGFIVKTSNNGDEAWQYLLENRPSLIILDFVMPQMDGFSLYKKIKERNILRDIPVIFLSGLSLQEITEKIEPSDLKRYLRKPFRTADILSLINEALNSEEEKSNSCQYRIESGRIMKAEEA